MTELTSMFCFYFHFYGKLDGKLVTHLLTTPLFSVLNKWYNKLKESELQLNGVKIYTVPDKRNMFFT